MTRTIWCFAHGHEGSWEAICLDFDIAAQGRTLEEVKSRLVEAVRDYVAAANEENERDRASLLSRRAPLLVRAKLGLRFFLASIWPHDRGEESTAGFSLPCPA